MCSTWGEASDEPHLHCLEGSMRGAGVTSSDSQARLATVVILRFVGSRTYSLMQGGEPPVADLRLIQEHAYPR
jgi:hypothetical protein